MKNTGMLRSKVFELGNDLVQQRLALLQLSEQLQAKPSSKGTQQP
ncbi:hypothetical protein [Catenovulum sediminis]|uniref:Uncharacterized protein n=1 Tax=Catenovulum sediminis TaxID=1740262 RepID=A0ABV1RDW8_9ALTE